MASERQTSESATPENAGSQADSKDLTTLVPEIEADWENPIEDSPDPARPVVVEDIEGDPVSCERSMSVLCPACGDVLRRYPTGMPRHLGRVEMPCEGCETELLRWALLAVGTAHEQTPSPAVRRTATTEYWEARLWAGIVTGETSPRTREYSNLYGKQAATFGWDWTVTCPLCRRALSDLKSGLDYHHWRREPDQGVCLCRVCHDAISGQQRDVEIDWEAQEKGLQDKHDLQLTRLALRGQMIKPSDSLRSLVARLCDRYHLVQPPAEVFLLAVPDADRHESAGSSQRRVPAGGSWSNSR